MPDISLPMRGEKLMSCIRMVPHLGVAFSFLGNGGKWWWGKMQNTGQMQRFATFYVEVLCYMICVETQNNRKEIDATQKTISYLKDLNGTYWNNHFFLIGTFSVVSGQAQGCKKGMKRHAWRNGPRPCSMQHAACRTSKRSIGSTCSARSLEHEGYHGIPTSTLQQVTN